MMSLSEWEAELKCSATRKPGAAATTYDGVYHILGLASEAVTDGIKALGTL